MFWGYMLKVVIISSLFYILKYYYFCFFTKTLPFLEPDLYRYEIRLEPDPYDRKDIQIAHDYIPSTGTFPKKFQLVL